MTDGNIREVRFLEDHSEMPVRIRGRQLYRFPQVPTLADLANLLQETEVLRGLCPRWAGVLPTVPPAFVPAADETFSRCRPWKNSLLMNRLHSRSVKRSLLRRWKLLCLTNETVSALNSLYGAERASTWRLSDAQRQGQQCLFPARQRDGNSARR